MLSDGTWTYTWKHGRQLASMSDGSAAWTFTYHSDGLRTGRTNGTATYHYVYNGSSLSQMTVGSDTLNFAYDASGAPMSVSYNGTNYYYATNLQGDVTAILNASGTAVVQYTYDAWGNPLTTSGSMANTLGTLNPLRYRSYIYDQESGLYYLQSRYYNPEIGRFINADAFVSTGQGLLGNNMFAYCNNNPVNFIDPTGKFTIEIGVISGVVIAVVIVAGCAIAAYYLTAAIVTFIGWNESGWTFLTVQETYAADIFTEGTLPQQGLIEGDPDAPPVDAGKQGKHVPGHNNYREGKSSWPEGETGVEQTQEAWKNGVPDPKKPDGSVRIGVSSDGTTVRVHIDGKGAIHGYPISKFEFFME